MKSEANVEEPELAFFLLATRRIANKRLQKDLRSYRSIREIGSYISPQ